MGRIIPRGSVLREFPGRYLVVPPMNLRSLGAASTATAANACITSITSYRIVMKIGS